MVGCSTAKKLTVSNSPKSIENAVPDSLKFEPDPNEKWVAWQFAQPLPDLDDPWQALLLDPFNESQVERAQGKEDFQRRVAAWLNQEPVDANLTFEETIEQVTQNVNLMILSAEVATVLGDEATAFRRLKMASHWLDQSLGGATDLRAKTLTASRLQVWEAAARLSESTKTSKAQRSELLKLVQNTLVLDEVRGLIRRDYATETVARFQTLMSASDPAKAIVTTLAGDIDPEPYVEALTQLLQSKEHPLNGPESINLSGGWIERLTAEDLTISHWDALVGERDKNSTDEFKLLKENPDQKLKIANQPNSVGRLIAFEFTQDAFTAFQWAVYQQVQRDAFTVRINHTIAGNYELAKQLRSPISDEPYQVDLKDALLIMNCPTQSMSLESMKQLLESGAAEFGKPVAR